MKKGIDISTYQKTVHWDRVTADFVMIRVGTSQKDGGLTMDDQFFNNVAGAQRRGIPWGVYLFANDVDDTAATKSANQLAQFLKARGYRIPYPVAYDFEATKYVYNSKKDNTAICEAFLSALQGHGFYVMLYTYTNFAKGFLDMKDLAAYDLWIADYTGKVGWTGPYGMWQRSGSGTAPGIDGAVDLDEAYKDYPSIIRGAGLNGYGETAGKPNQPDNAALLAENQALREKAERQTAQLETAQKKLEEIREIVEE